MRLTSTAQEQKEQAAREAVQLIESGMVVGLGGGTTAAIAVRMLADLIGRGQLHGITGVPCSSSIEAEARSLGVPITSLQDVTAIDLTIDGADEVDPDLNLIKGGGGALLHEKIVAQASRRLVIIVDASKPSARLGTKWALPVEVFPFSWLSQARFLEGLGAEVNLRRGADGRPFETDEGNFMLDARFGPISDPHSLARELSSRAGIAEHGLFLGMTDDLLIAGDHGVAHVRRKAA